MMTLTINGQRYTFYIGRDELYRFLEYRGELFTSWALPDDNTHYYGGDVPMYLVNGYRPCEDDVDWSAHDRSVEYLEKHLKGEALIIRDNTPWDEIVYWSENGDIHLDNDVNDCLGGIFGWTC